MKSSWIMKLCLALAGIFVVLLLYFIAVYFVLFKPNFTRKTGPYTEKNNQQHWVNKAYEERCVADTAWWEASDRERFEITSRDGLKLVAYYLAHEKHKGIVLMMHGFHSTPMRDFASIARWYYEQGYSICLPYQRTHGESEGEYLTFGVKERFDAYDWVQELNERYGMENDIWVHGISMGCATVLMASGFDYPFNVRGIIADCGFTSPTEIMLAVMKSQHIPFPNLVVKTGDIFTRQLADFSLYEYDTYKALLTNETPVLFIHGTADTFVPAFMTLSNFEVCRAPKELVLVDGGLHAISFYKDEELYTSRLQAFLNAYTLIR
ncbi:MAG: alpha/beta hydrolase [Treponema sp.]|nr:alpha/beta hydrolase [Treponema sp.]